MATPSPEDFIAAYDATVMRVRQAVLSYLTAVWRSTGSYRDADVDQLVNLIVPRVVSGQVQVANLTSAYIASVHTLTTGATVAPALVDQAIVTGGRGVPAATVYTRPAVTVWTALAEGKPFDKAVEMGLDRLLSLAATDLQMAKVRQAQASFQSAGVATYRRVLHGASCQRCVAAAGSTYYTANLMPIHPNCDCSVAEDRDNRTPAPISDSLVVVQNHGEYGPTLTLRGQTFTGPNDLI